MGCWVGCGPTQRKLALPTTEKSRSTSTFLQYFWWCKGDAPLASFSSEKSEPQTHVHTVQQFAIEFKMKFDFEMKYAFEILKNLMSNLNVISNSNLFLASDCVYNFQPSIFTHVNISQLVSKMCSHCLFPVVDKSGISWLNR